MTVLQRARRRAAIVVTCLLVAALACNFPGQAGTPQSGSNGTAVIEEVQGQVTVRQSADGVDSAAQVNQVVKAGGQVGTQGGARAKLGISGNGSFVRLGESTNVNLLELSSNSSGPMSRFGLLEGKVWVVIDPSAGGQASVETPSGMATATGQMSVEFHSNFQGSGAPLFLVTCLLGVCSVSNPFGGVALTPGQQTEVVGSDSGPSQPHPMDPEQQADWQDNVPELGTGGGPEGPSPTPTVEEAAPPTTPPPGVTPPTATYTFTPTYTPTPTPLGPPCLIVNTDANIRGGPGTVYTIYGVKLAGETADVVGTDSTQTWYVIAYPQSPNGQGWIWGQLVTLCGDQSNVPIIPAPPTPTYTPTATSTVTLTFTPSNTPTVTLTPTATLGTTFPAPSINANPNPVTAGCDLTNTVISWQAVGAGSATLNGERVTVPSGKAAVCVLQDTVYTLIAKYADGTTKQVQVTVTVEVIK